MLLDTFVFRLKSVNFMDIFRSVTSETHVNTGFIERNEMFSFFVKLCCREVASIISFQEYAKIAWYLSQIVVALAEFGVVQKQIIL